MKIISLVPSITEALFDFGLSEKEIIGRTKFCIHPEKEVSKIQIIGGTKNIHLDKICGLNPDLIIANKEENEKDQIEALSENFNVWLTDIENIEQNRIFIRKLGNLLKREHLAEKYIQQIDNCFPDSIKKTKAAYLIWKNPLMTVGSDTFIHDIMNRTGFENIFGDQKRYPEISLEKLDSAEIILLSTEPFPFKQKHVEEFQAIFPHKKIMLVEGEAFSWYGTHLSKRKEYFEKLRNEVFS